MSQIPAFSQHKLQLTLTLNVHEPFFASACLKQSISLLLCNHTSLPWFAAVFATSSINNDMLNAAHVTCMQVKQDQSVHKSD